MPRFEITAPDGRKFEVNAPEGATEQDAIAYIQQQEAARAERIAARTAEYEQQARDGLNADLNLLERAHLGMARGLTELGQGAKQLALNTGAAVGLVDDKKAEDYNAAVREESRLWENGLGSDTAANIGRIGTQIAVTSPLSFGAGGWVKGAQTLGTQLARAGAVGAASGALGSALNPVTEGGSYWGGKAQQLGTGAVVGGVLGAGSQGAIRAVEGLANAPRAGINAAAEIISPQSPQQYEIAIKLAQEAGDVAKVEELQAAAQQAMKDQGGVIGRMLRGSVAQQRRGDRTAEITGIDLAPAERSGSPVARQLHNWARQSIFTRWQMFKGDYARGRQMINSIESLGKEIGGQNVSPETFAQQLQGKVRGMVENLASRRTEVAGGAYREIDRINGKALIVGTENTLEEAAKLADEFKNSSADAAKIRAWAENFFSRLQGDGRLSASDAIGELQGFEKAARTGVGLFEGIQDRSTATVAASRLAKAMMRDLEAAESQAGGSVGDALREANRLWRSYSSEIANVEGSALGRIVGDDLVGEISGIAQNTTSPERVLGILDGLSATELRVVKDYLLREAPDLWRQFQRTTLERATAVAREAAPSMGERPLPINPRAFVGELTGRGGRSSVNQQARMNVIFDGDYRPKLKALIDAGRRMGDLTGYNHSGSGVYQETTGVLQGIMNPVKQGAATVLGLGTLNAVARGAQPGAARVPLRMLEAPQWATTAALTPVAALSAEGSRQALEVPVSGGTEMTAAEADALNRALIEYRRRQAGQSQ